MMNSQCYAVWSVRRVAMDEQTALTGDDNGTNKATRNDNDIFNEDDEAATMIPCCHMISCLRRILIIMNMAQIVKT